MKRKLELIIELLFILVINNPAYSNLNVLTTYEEKTIAQDSLFH